MFKNSFENKEFVVEKSVRFDKFLNIYNIFLLLYEHIYLSLLIMLN